MLEVLWYALTFLAGLGAGFILKVRIDASRRTTATTTVAGDSQGKVTQRDNTVGGHMSGRDVSVKRD